MQNWSKIEPKWLQNCSKFAPKNSSKKISVILCFFNDFWPILGCFFDPRSEMAKTWKSFKNIGHASKIKGRSLRKTTKILLKSGSWIMLPKSSEKVWFLLPKWAIFETKFTQKSLKNHYFFACEKNIEKHAKKCEKCETSKRYRREVRTQWGLQ